MRVPSKKHPPGLAKETLDNLANVLVVAGACRCFAAPPCLGVSLDVAVVAQRAQVVSVVHTALALGVANRLLYRADVVHLSRRCYPALICAALAEWVLGQLITAEAQPPRRMY